MFVKGVHTVSAVFISFFVGLHLFNHLWSISGPEEHIKLMNDLRKYYRNPFAETLLLVIIVTQLISGVQLFIINRKKAKDHFEKLQLWTGLYLLFFLVIHLVAVLGARLFFDVDTNFYFGVAGINIFPLNLFFIPYYTMAIVSFFGHIASVHAKKTQWVVCGLTPHQQAKMIIVIGMVITIVLFYGFTNQFSGMKIPEPYNLFE